MNSSTCTLCRAGYYTTQSGAQACAPCLVGTYSTSNGSNTSAACTACAAGTYQQCSLIVSDSGNHLIRQTNIETGDTITLAGNYTGDSTYIDGFGLGVNFGYVGYGPSLSPDGSYMLFLDLGGCRLRKLVFQTQQVTTVLGGSVCGNSVFGTGSQAVLNLPQNLLVSSDFSFAFITDVNARQIQYVNLSTWTLSPFVGQYGVGKVQDGIGTNAGIGIFHNGNSAMTPDNAWIFFEDFGYIRMVQVNTSNVTTIVGNGSILLVDGVARKACVGSAGVLAIDPAQTYMVIAETSFPGEVLRIMNLTTLKIQIVAGQANTTGSTDGIGTAATFNGFWSMVFSPDGTRIFIGFATGDPVIRVVTVGTWAVTHLAGNRSGIMGYADGLGASVLFNGIRGLAVRCSIGATQCVGCVPGNYSTAQESFAVHCRANKLDYLKPPMDVDIRWKSTATLLAFAHKYQNPLTNFVAGDAKLDNEKYSLTPAEYARIPKLLSVLEVSDTRRVKLWSLNLTNFLSYLV